MTALRFDGPVLPDGERQELYVVDGRVSAEPVAGAETAGSGWIVPGLVDAHNHLGLEDHGAVDDAEVERQALADRDSGVLLTRDCGSPADTRWTQQRADLPRLVRCGRHIARTRRYLRDYGVEVEPEDLDATVAQEAAAGDGWVKLVGDWISRDSGDLAPSFPEAALASAVATAHRHGAKVTAHCFGPDVLPGLLAAGIDCLEHGTGLDQGQVELMAAAGVGLVPTVLQTDKFPEFAEAGRERFPAYAATMEALHRRRRHVLMAAHEAGVPLYVGSDGGGTARHGYLHEEVRAMVELGLPAETVVAAASWRGRSWLGFDSGVGPGEEADFCVYDADPRVDPSVLARPTRVVLRGQVVA